MTMFAYILVLVCACALAEGKKAVAPSYVENMEVMMKAIDVLQKNVVSMGLKVPRVDDPRRHYAEVVWAVCQQARNMQSCMPKDYNVEYPKVLNKTAAMGLIHPQMVMDDVAELLQKASSMTEKIRSLIEVQCINVHPKDCNEVIDEEVRSDQVRYDDDAKTLMVVAEAASAFMDMEAAIAVAAKRHAAVKFVVEGKDPLKKLIMATVDMKKWIAPILC